MDAGTLRMLVIFFADKFHFCKNKIDRTLLTSCADTLSGIIVAAKTQREANETTKKLHTEKNFDSQIYFVHFSRERNQ